MKKNLIFLFVGLFLGCVASFAAIRLYEGDQVDKSRIKTAQALQDTVFLREEIASAILKQSLIEGRFYSKNELEKISPVLTSLYQARDGSLVLKISNGAMVWFHPEKSDGRVAWRCLGGSSRDVPAACREVPRPTVQ
jgi:hypothetical protein